MPEIQEEAAKYGYIQRYKEEKEEITGISHEPWHFRFGISSLGDYGKKGHVSGGVYSVCKAVCL